MKKVLFTATVDSHILHFHLPFLRWFKERGYEVHVASKGDSKLPFVDKKYNIPFERSPFKRENMEAYTVLKEIIEKNKYAIIHCHTPVGGVLTRLAARKFQKRNKIKVIYTAHGFHFFRGGPKLNWLLFYPVEKLLSKYTDILITINNEDYKIARDRFYAKKILLIPGVGIDLNKFSPLKEDYQKIELRRKYGFSNNEFILIYVAELSYRKHQDFLIKAITKLQHNIPNIKLILVGSGDYLSRYQKLVEELDLNNKVCFLGYRNDINNLMRISDVAVSTSRQEGLPVNIMEAMASGLPVISTNCRGNRDLVSTGENGFIIENDNLDDLIEKTELLYNNEELREKFRENNIKKAEDYSLNKIMKLMEKVYLD